VLKLYIIIGVNQDLSTGWSTIYYSSNWINDHSPANDWCIAVLNDNIGNDTGWCGIQNYSSDSSLNGKMGYAYGYPGGYSLNYGENQWMTNGIISSVNSSKFDIGTLFVGGISGGPVYLSSGGNMIVGMCKGYYNNVNDLSLCTRITQNMVNIVNSL